MATRLYLPATAAPTAINPTPDAAWEDTSILARAVCRTTKINDTLATVSFTDATNTDKDILFRQYVSLELLAGQTITGSQALKFQVRAQERVAGNNMFAAFGIRVIASDGSTVRKTVLAVNRDGVEINNSALTNRASTATSAATNYTTLAGDRLVIEIGTGGDPANTGGADHDTDLRLGDSSGSDLPENDTATTDDNPWVELADTLTFVDPEIQEWEQPQQLPIPHNRFVAEITKSSGFGLAEDSSGVDKWGQPQATPLPIRRHLPPKNYAYAEGFDESTFAVAEFDPGTEGFPYQAQQPPIQHRKFQVTLTDLTAALPLSEIEVEGFPYLPQQEPIPHNSFQAFLTSRVTGFSLRIDVLPVFTPIAQATPHRRAPGSHEYATGLDETTFGSLEFDPVDGFPYQPQQEPVQHRKFQAALTSRLTGYGLDLFDAYDGFPYLPQQEPIPHVTFTGDHRNQYTTGFDETTFDNGEEFDPGTTGFPYQPQQEPIPHNKLEASFINFFVSHLPPESVGATAVNLSQQPHRRAKGWNDYTQGADETTFSVPAFDPGAEGFPYTPQQSPISHTTFTGDHRNQYTTGFDESTFFDAALFPYPPQSEPIPHRFFSGGPTRVTGFSLRIDVLPVFVPAAEPIPHRKAKGSLEYTQGPDETTFATDTFDPGAEGFPYQPQQEPIPHRTFVEHGIRVMFGVAEDPTPHDRWGQPQQEPIPHRTYVGWTEPFQAGIDTTITDPAASIQWDRTQQLPIPHRTYAGWTEPYQAGIDTSIIDPSANIQCDRTQQAPIPHRTYLGWNESVSGPDPSSLEDTTRIYWIEQQQPIPHRWFRPPSGIPTSGLDASLLEFEINTHWFQPQSPPLPIARRNVYLDQYTVGQEESLFAPPFDPGIEGFPYLPQQEPIPHNWFTPWKGEVSGIEVSLLEPSSYLHWFQPQSPPLPIAKRNVYLDQYTSGIDENVFAPLAGMPYWDQQPPIPHRWFKPWQGTVSGVPADLLETVFFAAYRTPQQEPIPHKRAINIEQYNLSIEPTLIGEHIPSVIHWYQPQQSPIPHRTFTSSSIVLDVFELPWEPLNGFPYQPQQQPISHTTFIGPTSAILAPPPSSLEEESRVHWMQPQQLPVHHNRFQGPSLIASAPEPSLIDFTTYAYFHQPQQEPLPHTRFIPASGSSPTGIPDELLDLIQLQWYVEPLPPTPHNRPKDSSNIAFLPAPDLYPIAIDWHPEQQQPIPHRTQRWNNTDPFALYVLPIPPPTVATNDEIDGTLVLSSTIDGRLIIIDCF